MSSCATRQRSLEIAKALKTWPTCYSALSINLVQVGKGMDPLHLAQVGHTTKRSSKQTISGYRGEHSKLDFPVHGGLFIPRIYGDQKKGFWYPTGILVATVGTSAKSESPKFLAIT